MQYSAFIISLAIAASVNGFASNVDVDALAARNPTVAEANDALDNFAASVAARDARGGAFLKSLGQEAGKGAASAIGSQAVNGGAQWLESTLGQRDVDPVVEANEALRNLITRDVDPVVEANEALRNLIARDAKVNIGGLIKNGAKSGASSGANFLGSQAVNWGVGEAEKFLGGDDQSTPPAGAQRRDAMPKTTSHSSPSHSSPSTHDSPSTHTSENGGGSSPSKPATPSQPASAPSQPASAPSKPATPSQPASAPSQPASAPSKPATPSQPASAPSQPASKPSNAAPSSAGSPPAASSSSGGFGTDILKEFGLGAANSAGSNGVTGLLDIIKGAAGGETPTPTPTPSAAPARRDAFGAHGFRGAGPMGGIGGARGGPRPQMGGIEAREAKFSLGKPSKPSTPSSPSKPSTPSSGAEPATSSGGSFLKDAGMEFLKGGALAGGENILSSLTGQATETPTPSAAPARR